jgi:hypothetical protein
LSDYVVSEAQIIQPQTTVYGQVESERSISVLYILTTTIPVEISTEFVIV